MFTRRKVLLFGLICFLFLLADFWVYRTLDKAFVNLADTQVRETAGAALEAVPAGDEAIWNWVDRLEQGSGHFFLLYTRGIHGIDPAVTVFSKNPDLSGFFESRKDSPEFRKALENATYDEITVLPERVVIGGAPRTMLVVPATDPATGETVGTGLFAFDTAAADGYSRLLAVLAIGAAVLFLTILGAGQFTRDPVQSYAILGLFAITGTFVAYPRCEAARLTFIQDGRFTHDTWKTILTTRQYVSALKGSLQLGFVTATLSTLVGFLFAFTVTRTTIPFKKFFSAMATLPVVSPPFSLTLSIILLFGNNGLVTKQLLGLERFNIYGLWGLSLVQTMGMFPIAFLTLVGILEAIDSTLEDAALDLSATRWETFRTVTLPLATPGILSAWLLVFTTSLADFANPLLLSGDFRVLSVESYLEVTGMNRLGNGAALSLLLLLPTLTAFLAQRFWVSRKSVVTVTGKPSARLTELASPATRRVLLVSMTLITLFLFSLYGTILAGCFVKNWGIDYTFTLANFREALERGRDALSDTVLLAGAATPIAGLVAMAAAMLIARKAFPGKRLLEMLIMTPFALPGTLVGISYILAFNKPPLLLVGTAAIIVINYAIRELPVGVEGGIASLKQIDPSIEEAAADLGADTPTVFRTIVLPLVRPAFISSLSYTFVRSMTAVSAVIFLISARWYHLTVLIYNFSESLRFGLASVLALTLIVIVFATFGIMRLLIRKNVYLEKTVS